MSAKFKNARFWEWVNDGWVKITLKPDQKLQHGTFSYTDEGWSSTLTEWYHDLDTVERSDFSDGVDCDGRISRSNESSCPIEYLKARDMSQVDGMEKENASIFAPEWEHGRGAVYDREAEKAGY